MELVSKLLFRNFPPPHLQYFISGSWDSGVVVTKLWAGFSGV